MDFTTDGGTTHKYKEFFSLLLFAVVNITASSWQSMQEVMAKKEMLLYFQNYQCYWTKPSLSYY